MQVAADYSSSAARMWATGVTPLTTMQNTGTLNCANLLSPSGASTTNCGLFSAGLTPLFGNCNHLNVDEPTQYVTCGDLTSFHNPNFDFFVRQTMAFSLAGSMLNPVVQGVGIFNITGGAAATPTGGASAFTK
jgi:hypothetical protein